MIRQTEPLSQAKRDEIISKYLSSPGGRRQLAQSMAQPIKRSILDYVACPVCGESVANDRLTTHAAEVGDDAHQVMEVMES